MKKQCIAMKMQRAIVTVSDKPGRAFEIKLPEGCIGILLCFESIKAAKKYWGNDVETVEIGTGSKKGHKLLKT